MAKGNVKNKPQTEYGEGLPKSLEIEKAVLGMVLLNELAYHELVGAGLQVDYFALDSNRRIFRAMQVLVQSHKTPDLLMLVDELERLGELVAVGGAAFISALLDGVPESAGSPHLREYVDLRRQAIFAANGLAACAMDPGDSIRQSVALATEQLLRVQGSTANEPASFVSASTQAVLDEVSDLMYVERPVIGIPYGIQDLDDPTTGLRVGEITTVGGYPGCVAPETMIEGIPIAERARQELSTLFGRARPEYPFVKGRADLYEVLTRAGSRVVVTVGHRFLTPTGWCRLRDLCVGSLIAADGSERGLPASGTARSSQGCYSMGLRQDGGLLHPAVVALRDKLQQLRKRGVGDTSSVFSCFHPSRNNSSSPSSSSAPGRVLLPWPATASRGELRGSDFLSGEQNPSRYSQESRQQERAGQCLPWEDRTSASDCPLGIGSHCGASGWPSLAQRQREGCAPTVHNSDRQDIDRQQPVRLESALADETFWDEIVAITFVRHGQFYDLEVPFANHYSACGLWHHNSAKTAFALNVCRTAAKSGYPVAFFSLEMTKEQLILRLFAQESDISYSKLRNPKNLFRDERRQLDFWKEHVDALPLLIDDRARTIEEIIPRAHLYVRQHGVKLIAIDYLQLIEAPGDKEYDKVSAASDAIWWLERSTQVPILVLSQLSRPEGRNRGANQPPSLHMLRSSGKIEQNAHNVLLLHRGYDDDGAPTGDDLIIIAKQRAGLVGRVKAHFNGPSQRWEERGSVPPPQQPALPGVVTQ
jgi:replicative DNA helicase